MLAASDGELYGHHKKFADLTLAHAVTKRASEMGITITNLEAYLARDPDASVRSAIALMLSIGHRTGLFDAMSIELTAAERVAVNRRPTESLQALLAYGQVRAEL